MVDKNSVSSEMLMVIALLLRTTVVIAVWLTEVNLLFFNINYKPTHMPMMKKSSVPFW